MRSCLPPEDVRYVLCGTAVGHAICCSECWRLGRCVLLSCFADDSGITIGQGPNIVIVDIYSGAVLHAYLLDPTDVIMQALRDEWWHWVCNSHSIAA